MESHSSPPSSLHQPIPGGQFLTRHPTPVVVALVGLRPPVAEAATGGHPQVRPEEHPPCGPPMPPGYPPARSTPQSAEPDPPTVVPALPTVVTASQPV